MCVRVQQLLKTGSFGNCIEAVEAYEQRCHKVFPLATAFKPLQLPAELVGNKIGQLEDGTNPNPHSQEEGGINRDKCSGGQGSP